jgi:hypothetical protein
MQQLNFSYRCYFLDARNHIAKVEVFDASTDAEALLVAGRLRDEQTSYPRVEVWDQARKVWGSSSVVSKNGARVESAESYDNRAAEFDARAERGIDPTTKQLQIEMAERYRGMAREARAVTSPFERRSRVRSG